MVSMGDMLRPLRLGFGTPYGCEAAVHAARLHLHSSPGSIMVKLDFKNAFNLLTSRQDVDSCSKPGLGASPVYFLSLRKNCDSVFW